MGDYSISHLPSPLDRPIFILGVPRSGTTVLHRLLSRHGQVAWLSGLCVRYPHRPSLNGRLMQALDLPLLGPLLQRRFKPWEAYDFWEYHCKGFRRPFRDLHTADATAQSRQQLPHVFSQLVSARRNRLLVKITGWPRLGFLQAIFPDALFIHIVRDGRAVANSLIQTDFWQGWAGPGQWRWGPLNPAQQHRWETAGQSFIALAGIQWQLLLETTGQASAHLPAGRFLEVRYEALCADPAGQLRQVADFCGLPWGQPFAAQVAAYPIHNSNDKWRTDLTAEQQHTLEETIGECLRYYGYLT